MLRSEKNLYEDNYIKYISNNTSDRSRSKANHIRIALAKLGNIITKKDRDGIRKELYKTENSQKLTRTQKEEYRNYPIELENILSKKGEYKRSGYSDLGYVGIRDVENLFISADKDYYEPALVKSYFENNYEYHEIRGDKDKKLSMCEYFYMIMPKLEELINKRKNNNNKDEQKVQLIMGVNFTHTIVKEITRTFYVRSDNEEITLGAHTSDIINKLTESFLSNYQEEEQISRSGSDFVYDGIDILGIHFHNIKLKRGKSYIKSPSWISSKKATIITKNTRNNKYFQYVITVALNHKEISNHPERISNIRPHISKYNWDDKNFPAGTKDFEKFERNNNDIVLNILYAPPSKKEIKIIYKSKYNRKHKNQVVLLMITDIEQQDTIEKWHYIALKREIDDDGNKKPTECLSALYS